MLARPPSRTRAAKPAGVTVVLSGVSGRLFDLRDRADRARAYEIALREGDPEQITVASPRVVQLGFLIGDRFVSVRLIEGPSRESLGVPAKELMERNTRWPWISLPCWICWSR
jgi:hypothetical protein